MGATDTRLGETEDNKAGAFSQGIVNQMSNVLYLLVTQPSKLVPMAWLVQLTCEGRGPVGQRG